MSNTQDLKQQAETLFETFTSQVANGETVDRIDLSLVSQLSATKRATYFEHFYVEVPATLEQQSIEGDVTETPLPVIQTVPIEELLAELITVDGFAQDNHLAYREVTQTLIAKYQQKVEDLA